jgi:hypothetical protein
VERWIDFHISGSDDVGFGLPQQHIGTIQFASLNTGEMKSNRVDQGIDCCMNPGIQPAFAPPDDLIGAPFFSALALCWRANNDGIDHHIFVFGIGGQMLK